MNQKFFEFDSSITLVARIPVVLKTLTTSSRLTDLLEGMSGTGLLGLAEASLGAPPGELPKSALSDPLSFPSCGCSFLLLPSRLSGVNRRGRSSSA